jgi:hypothetical protein
MPAITDPRAPPASSPVLLPVVPTIRLRRAHAHVHSITAPVSLVYGASGFWHQK